MEAFAAMLASSVKNFAQMDDPTRILTLNVYSSLPDPPVATAAPLSNAAAASSAPDGIDRIRGLPDDILRGVVSRLPARDAARTTALSKCWRRVWHSVPLVLADAHLLPAAVHAAAVSRALDAHPGPFRCVHLAGTPMAAHRAEVTRWLLLLAAKDVQELVFVNRPTTIRPHLQLPGALFACTSLTRLYLGFWRYPDNTTALPPDAIFPCLRELGLCSVVIDELGLAFLVENCPVLEKLIVVESRRCPVPIRIRSSSLRCVQVRSSVVPEITVGHASVLERLFLWEVRGESRGLVTTSSRIKIGYAPNLRFLGFLVPGMHQLEIGNTVIKAATNACTNITVPSVQMLAIQVKLGTHIKAMMLPSFLRCFPNTETPYIQSEDDGIQSRGPLSSISGNGKLDLKFWEEADPIECVQGHIRKLILREFRGRRSELDFLRFIAERAQVLENMVVEMAHGFSPSDQVGAKLKTFMASAKWANGCCKLIVSQSPFWENKGTPWCYLRAFDRSILDPFDASKCAQGKCLK